MRSYHFLGLLSYSPVVHLDRDRLARNEDSSVYEANEAVGSLEDLRALLEFKYTGADRSSSVGG